LSAGACHPRGFAAGTASCGMYPQRRDDLALLVSDRPASAAGVFTTNRVVAAPVTVSREQLAGGGAQAVVTNAGVANACTGRQGLEDAWAMVGAAAESAAVAREQVLVASTGVIGQPLPLGAVAQGIAAAGRCLAGGNGRRAAEAIRTTDAFPKLGEATVELSGGSVRIGGMAKGAGMIRPDMATTLAQFTTDAQVAPAELAAMVGEVADASFNRISVDGCTSTNDCVFLLANGAAGVGAVSGHDLALLREALSRLALDLATMVVRDGEGATRVCTYTVSGAVDAAEARAAARAVADNVLVKCALHGADPNWGRILAALGASGITLDAERVGVAVGGVAVVRAGAGVADCGAAAASAMSKAEVEIDIDLGQGEGTASVIGADLSPAYVSFNAGATT
jgi:glutamate N-acetyltransferase / amino-acid N-acetyltransferase